jgi:hypothetical protein
VTENRRQITDDRERMTENKEVGSRTRRRTIGQD